MVLKKNLIHPLLLNGSFTFPNFLKREDVPLMEMILSMKQHGIEMQNLLSFTIHLFQLRGCNPQLSAVYALLILA